MKKSKRLRKCVDANGLDEYLEYGHWYLTEPSPETATMIVFLEDTVLYVSIRRFSGEVDDR